MSANTNIRVTELDFSAIKANFRAYLASLPEYADYNFEGSNFSVLMDLLAYNTHYNSFYQNMVANETFLDTGLLRDSIVSRAKELSYVPTSTKGAQSTVSITIDPTPSTPVSITVPRGTKFTTTANDVTYTFQTETDYTIVPVGGAYVGTGIEIYEGVETTERFTVSTASKYVISNPNVDISSLSVTVQNSNSDISTSTFSRATDTNEVNQLSKVYFLQEVENFKYEVYFGDGILGKGLTNGNIVKLRYRISNGSLLNGANTFTSASAISGFSDVTVTATAAASGGAERESIDSIKFNAPKNYEIQNRLVTARDYERFILNQNPDISAISVWGGEDNDPPKYGQIFVSAKPSTGTTLSTARKASIIAAIKQKDFISNSVEIVDPTYIYVNVTSNVKYNPAQTTLTDGQVKTVVLTSISSYNTSQLSTFGKAFRLSRLSRTIDNSNDAILSNDTTFTLEIRQKVSTTLADTYTLEFGTPIDLQYPGHFNRVSSSAFTYSGNTCYLNDNGYGIIRIYYLNDLAEKVYVDNEAGTVNYATGEVVLTNFLPTSVNTVTNIPNELKITIVPSYKDISPTQRRIISIGTSTINISQESDDIALVSGNY
jgi:hypothetical protein